MAGLADRLRVFVESPPFHRTVVALILANAALMGLETSQAIVAQWGGAMAVAQVAFQVAFVIEISLRLAAHGRRPAAFFWDGWNVFDFVVVATSFLPVAGAFTTVARLARVLRVARLVSALPELRLIVGTMLRSIPSLGHVVALLGLLLYVYGVFGYHLFAGDAPQHWGSLPLAFQSLVQVLTLEGWVEMQDAVLPKHPWAWAYFGSFIVVAVFVVINLFIAVVINNLESTREDEKRRSDEVSSDAVLREAVALRERIESLEALLRRSRAA